ncbi:MAG TPA: hypothetical protein VML75_17905 [Kofleriaceae bacterium]|nr:hypothetical protein [Kofleriaceae bacterium]
MRNLSIAAAVLALLSACGGSSATTETTPTLPPTSDEAAAARAKAKADPPAVPAEPAVAEPTEEEPAAGREQVIDRAVAMFFAVAKLVNAAAGDCAKMAANLNSWLDRNDQERNLVMDELAKIPEEERVDDFNRKMMKHREVIEEMQQSVGACVGTPAFDEAWQRLEP